MYSLMIAIRNTQKVCLFTICSQVFSVSGGIFHICTLFFKKSVYLQLKKSKQKAPISGRRLFNRTTFFLQFKKLIDFVIFFSKVKELEPLLNLLDEGLFFNFK
jgi:hypothetical protein